MPFTLNFCDPKRKRAAKMSLCRQRGFTVIELMIVVVILAVLASVAIPSYHSTRENRRLIGAAEELYANIQFARGEAIKRNNTVHVNFTGSGTTGWCYGLSENNSNPSYNHDSCDCSTTPTDCTIDDGLQRVVYSTTLYPDVVMTTTYDNTTANNLDFETVRGMPTPTYTVQFNINSKQVNVKVLPLGQMQICTPTGSTLPSYKDC